VVGSGDLLVLGVESVAAVAAGDALELAPLGPTDPLLSEPALGVQLDHGPVAERLDLLGSAQPHPCSAWGPRRTGSWPWFKAANTGSGGGGGPPAGALAGGGDGALADCPGVAGPHAEAVAGQGFA
jgi:hypothetical protein